MQPPERAAAVFVTPWPWLWYGALWATVMLGVNHWLPPIHLGGPAILYALTAAGATVYFPCMPRAAFGAAEVVRFAAVDTVFLGCVVALLFPLLLLGGRVAGAEAMDYGSPPAYVVSVALFVLQFYLFLGLATAARSGRGAQRHMPAAAAAVAVLALLLVSRGPVAQRMEYDSAVAQKQAAYEQETGTSAASLRSEIALSLHGFYGPVRELAVDSQGRIVVIGTPSLYAGHDVASPVRLAPDGRVDRVLGTPQSQSRLGTEHRVLHLLADDAVLLDAPQDGQSPFGPLVLRRMTAAGEVDAQYVLPVGRKG